MLRPRHPRPTGSSRFGALLDEDQLTGLEPARNRETLRLVLAAALTAAAAVGIGFLNSAASLTGLPVPRVRALLRRLQAAYLVQEHTPGRYRMHNLTRLYAAEQARENSATGSDDALLRLIDYYLHTAHAAAGHLDPHRDRNPLAPARPGAAPEEPADLAAALAWFTAEHLVLLDAVDIAVRSDRDRCAWLLAHALETYFDYRGHWHDWAASQHTALDAARRLADPSWQAGAHRGLGLGVRPAGEPR